MIKEITVMRGPNMWSSNHNRLIVVKFYPLSQVLSGPQQELVIKQLQDHYDISPADGEFDRTLFLSALQLASLLQGEGYYCDLKYPSAGILYGVVQYEVEEAGLAAVNAAFGIIDALIGCQIPQPLSECKAMIRSAAAKYGNGPSTSMIIDAAKRRNIPVTAGPAGYTIFGYGKKQKKISAAMSHYTSCIGVNIAGNKEHTKKFLENANIPVPKGIIVTDEADLKAAENRLGWPLVVKPFNGNQGRNVTCSILNFEDLLLGFRQAKLTSKSIIVEKEIAGDDYRLLVIGNKFCAASLRLAASVVGDGTHTITALVEKENSDPRRGNGHENVLTKIKIDDAAEAYLAKQGLLASSVPASGQRVFLKSTANLSTGGTAGDVTDLVHPANKLLAEKVSRIIGLDICGIDVMSTDISVPLIENGGAVIEVNAAPGLRMHKFPGKGTPREVGGPIIDLMFGKNDDGRIPIVAITGTNGKTTTTRLMAHLADFAGNVVGFSSTDGIYIGAEKIQSGDCSGPQSARTILQDTTVDFAVLECARGGIIRSGLGFDQCDIAIVTNVAADHLGLKDIHTVEDLANVKAVVPMSVKKDGWAILNAANPYSYEMKNKVRCNVALFCPDEENSDLQQHIAGGGTAVFTDAVQDIYIVHDRLKIPVCNAAEIPITRNGKAGFMIENLLPVVLSGYLLGIGVGVISDALMTFIPSAEKTPGRINEFVINGVNVIIDYAHNPHGMRALAGYLKNIDARKVGIITGTGDRREEDIIEFGQIAASVYDEIIIRFDRDLRGRTKESIVGLLARGITEVSPGLPYQVIPEMKDAITHAIENAEKDSYVVVCADNATYTVGVTKDIAAQFGKSL